MAPDFEVQVASWRLSNSHETAWELWDQAMTEDDIMPSWTVEVPLSAFGARPVIQKDMDAARAGKLKPVYMGQGKVLDAAGNSFDAWPYDVVGDKVVVLVDNWSSPTGRRRPSLRRS